MPSPCDEAVALVHVYLLVPEEVWAWYEVRAGRLGMDATVVAASVLRAFRDFAEHPLGKN